VGGRKLLEKKTGSSYEIVGKEMTTVEGRPSSRQTQFGCLPRVESLMSETAAL